MVFGQLERSAALTAVLQQAAGRCRHRPPSRLPATLTMASLASRTGIALQLDPSLTSHRAVLRSVAMLLEETRLGTAAFARAGSVLAPCLLQLGLRAPPVASVSFNSDHLQLCRVAGWASAVKEGILA